MSDWTLNDLVVGSTSCLARGLTVHWSNAEPGELLLTLDRTAEVPETASLKYGDKQVFVGTLSIPSLSETGIGARRTVKYLDALQKMANVTACADFPFDTAVGVKVPRFLLAGKYQSFSPDGELAAGEVGQYDLVSADVAESLQAAIEYAGLTADVLVSGTMPAQLLENTPCLDVLKTGIRLLPAAQIYFQPTSETDGKVRVIPSSGDYSIAIDRLEDYAVTPRPDLVAAGAGATIVCYKERHGHGSDETPYVFTAGAAGGRTFGFTLAPEMHGLELAAMEVEKIKADDAEWWGSHDPRIRFVLDNQGDFPEYAGIVASGVIGINADGTGSAPTLTHAVLKGQIPQNFIDKGCSGPFGDHDKIFGVSNGINPVVGSCKVWAAFQLYTPGSAIPPEYDPFIVVKEFPLCIDASLTSDDSARGVWAYEDKNQYDPGEDPAEFAGLPATMVTAASQLTHQGRARWVATNDEMAAPPMGMLFNIADGSRGQVSEWSGINSPIHTVSIDLFNSRMEVEYGPSHYLGPADYVELIRAGHDLLKRHIKSKRPDKQGGRKPPLSPAYHGSQGSTAQPDPSTSPTVNLAPFGLQGSGQNKLLVGYSTIANLVPTGMTDGNNPPFSIDASASSGQVWGKLTYDFTTGEATAAEIGSGATMPADSGSTAYVLIGSWSRVLDSQTGLYKVQGVNARYGPISPRVCPVWLSSPQRWSIDWGGGQIV